MIRECLKEVKKGGSGNHMPAREENVLLRQAKRTSSKAACSSEE